MEVPLILDELMPRYDFAERHRTVVRAAPDAVYRAITETNLVGPLTRVLFALRAIPAAVVSLARSPRSALTEYRQRRDSRGQTFCLRDFEKAGFRILTERAPEEIVVGLLGRFWTPRGALHPDISVATFDAAPPAGHALAGWNFSVSPRPDGTCDLRTETRVLCAPDARWKFRLYWLLVRPGSGAIRRSMLRAIRLHAENGSRPTRPRA